MNKRELSERDICTKFITPAMIDAGWDVMSQVREEVTFTKGRIIVRGKLVTRGKASRADYILYHKPNLPIAIVEAKDNTFPVGGGMQQALRYAAVLDIPFVFSSNGDAFLFHDRTGTADPIEQELSLADFPTPWRLWEQYRSWKGLDAEREEIILSDYEEASGREPRYYQRVAINKTIEAVANEKDRILLVMATGTGKTYTAFQVIWRLWKAGRKKRVLFLADRNVLINQTMVNDFRPFGAAMAKLSTASKTIEREDGSEIEITTAVDKKHHRIDSSYEIYTSLYQAITGPEERQKLFRELSPDFFDLIVVDECHRGSAAEDSAWREILEYFSSATQIGMTATPKETEYVSNIDYFGEPVYSYSLKEGIEDGFLAPYKVIKVHLDVDIEGYRPAKGETDKYDRVIDDRHYNQKDFDRSLVIDERTRRVAKRVTEFLKESGDRMQKTIVFCEDQEHASRMRQALVIENGDLVKKNERYIMRITSDDDEGKNELDNFIDPESAYPVIVTTSQLLSTGVDVQTCRLIVLDRAVHSMTEFKQILGRGTRVHEETKKYFFTLMDFRKATNHFADPAFDGSPVQIYSPGENDPMLPPDGSPITGPGEEPIPPEPGPDEIVIDTGPPDISISTVADTPDKFHIVGNKVRVLAERVEYLDDNGKLITESLRAYSRRKLRGQFATLGEFLRRWGHAQRKEAILKELESEGLPLGPLAEEVGRDLDPFDLICHVAFDQPPLTRRERAEKVRKRDVFTKYGERARAVLEVLLRKYQDEGVTGIDDPQILRVPPLDSMGTPLELVRAFGGLTEFENAVHEVQSALYEEVA